MYVICYVKIFIFQSLAYFSSMTLSLFLDSLFRTGSLFHRVFVGCDRRRYSRLRTPNPLARAKPVWSLRKVVED